MFAALWHGHLHAIVRAATLSQPRPRASAIDPAGTTTATILTRAIFSEGCKSVAAGMNPMDLRRGINLAVDAVLADLKARTKMISTKEEITQVRTARRIRVIAISCRARTARPCLPACSRTAARGWLM